jgi:formylglycine-generating enzyme required for sulfatase activity
MTLTRLLLLLISLIGSSLVFGQSKTQKVKSVAEIFTPPNGQYLRDSLFIDETEITNIAYLEYLHYAKIDSAQSFYLDQLPDTTCWLKGFKPTDSVSSYVDHYYRYPGYRYFPVVGVSYEQAINYCKWRGKAVTEFIVAHSQEKKYANLKRYDVVVEYRLPTPEEWEFAACGGLDCTSYPHGLERPLKNKNYTFKIGSRDVCKCLDENHIKYNRSDVIHKVEFNLKDKFYFNLGEKAIGCTKNSAFDLAYVYNFVPNNLGLYNMIGNVSEMTSTKSVSKGGSFRHTLEDSTIEKNILYNNSEAWLGFRCIAVVHLKVKRGM